MPIIKHLNDIEIIAAESEYTLIILNPAAPIFKIQTPKVVINISSSFIEHKTISHVALNTITISITYDNYVELIDRWLNGEQFKSILQIPADLQNAFHGNKEAAV